MEILKPSDFQTHVTDSLARLETNMESLVGNGQPGRIAILENRFYRAVWIGSLLFAAVFGPQILTWMLK